jgi:hypothetical protein
VTSGAIRKLATVREPPGRVAVMVILFAVVAVIAFLRMAPPRLEFEEPLAFWDVVPTMNVAEYLVEPWAGYLQVFARIAFLLAHPFGDGGALVTRLLAAAVIALVAVYFASDALARAIPNVAVRTGFALALPMLPIPHPGPYVGPLNSQWWVALAVIGVALAPRRAWHYPALLGAGLVGVAPCVALPVFRDRRWVPLAIATALQAVTMIAGERRPQALAISADYVVVMLTVVALMYFAPLPLRTRLAFTYLSCAILLLGAILSGLPLTLNWRFMAIPGAALALAIVSLVLPRDVAHGEGTQRPPASADSHGRTWAA